MFFAIIIAICNAGCPTQSTQNRGAELLPERAIAKHILQNIESPKGNGRAVKPRNVLFLRLNLGQFRA